MTQNRCYQRDSGAGDLAAAPEGSCVYVSDDYLDSLAIPGITDEEADHFLSIISGDA